MSFWKKVLVLSGALLALDALIIALFLMASPAHAAKPTYCETRGAVAKALVKLSEDGTPIANLNVYFDPPPESATLWAERENWVRELKAELLGYLNDKIPREYLVQKVRAKCDVDAGKKVHSLRERSRNLMRIGSVPPITENDAATLIMGASSQAIVPPKAEEPPKPKPRAQECSEKLRDERHTKNVLALGIFTPDALRVGLVEAALKKEITPERFQKLMAMADAAEKALKAGTLEAWWDSYWQACVDGQ